MWHGIDGNRGGSRARDAVAFYAGGGPQLRSGTESVHLVAATVGFLSFFLIWVSVIWGLILRNGWISTRLRHAAIHGAHMITALMGLTLGTVHAFAQLAPPYATTHLVDVVVPFTNPTDPIGIGI